VEGSALRRSWTRTAALGVALLASLLAGEAHAQSAALEADVPAFPLRGYSAALRITHDNGFSYALGTGRYTLPTFLVKGQSSYDLVYSGATTVAGQDYEVPPLGIAGSVHVGWEL
jgi:hypothetical protein